jgi:uncharacterized protein YdeI (YjbR/CyaY-like superfamily)
MEKVTNISKMIQRREKESTIPVDLKKALTSNPVAQTAWDNATQIGRRDFITWIEGAKQPETRARRIGIACDKLTRGDKRPCCYAVVPMSLYKALGENPQAKTTWKDLSPNERRDLVSWIDEVDGKVPTTQRIDKVITMLKVGKIKLL